MRFNAFKAALPHTLPICVAFLFLGMSYGFFMQRQGFSFLYPLCMSLLIFAGSMEFIAVQLLLSPFNPLHAFWLTLAVNARHLFYGISMLELYKNCGRKKPYLVFGLCDESFSINCTQVPPPGVDRGWFMFFVTLLNHIYWVAGAALGGLLGHLIAFDAKGIEFVMTALFVVLFLNQWEEKSARRPAIIGVGCTVLCLLLFEKGNFILSSLLLIVLCLSLFRTARGSGKEVLRQ